MRVSVLGAVLCAAGAALAQDGGATHGFATLRGGTLGVEVTDLRAANERDPSRDAVRTAIAKGLEAEQIRVTADAHKVLRLQLQQVERRQGDFSLHCVQVKARLVDKDREFLPTPDVDAERCISDSPPSASNAGPNFAEVPSGVMRALEALQSGAKSHAYGEALADVLANLERRMH
jgi:hypothetical protein